MRSWRRILTYFARKVYILLLSISSQMKASRQYSIYMQRKNNTTIYYTYTGLTAVNKIFRKRCILGILQNYKSNHFFFNCGRLFDQKMYQYLLIYFSIFSPLRSFSAPLMYVAIGFYLYITCSFMNWSNQSPFHGTLQNDFLW